ncbi:MAG: discoidin domain-containing protein [Verrucomicrobiales bacterium]|nr:discoidin domain-containing protein [Verrucomicrobiales bacterium]
MRRKQGWINCFLAMFTIGAGPFALGNGGGYSGGGVSETGAITGFEPSGTGTVQIAEENLEILLKRDQAVVEVRYLLKNTKAASATVRFGFPVEELDELTMDEEEIEAEGSAPQSKRKTLDYCNDYRVEFDGRKVTATFELQPDAELSDPRRKGIRGWLVSEIVVPASATVPLTIGYRADYPTDELYVSDDERHAARIFQYRLSTGGVWAGPISKGTVTVRPDDIPLGDIRVLSPAGRFEKAGDSWQWSFTDLEPTLDDDLKIEAAPAYRVYGYRTMSGSYGNGEDEKRVAFIERGERWSVRHGNFSKITASSTLAPQKEHTYDVKNIADDDWGTVWAEGAKGDGSGEWIEATLEVPKPLEAVEITGGYQSDETLFDANARPKRVEIILNDDHHFEATLPDEKVATTIPVTGYSKPVKTVKVIVKAVYPGKKWEDCVITSLTVTTPLDKKPNVHPAR